MRQIILISVKVPSDAAGGIFGVLNKRRGVPIGSEQTAGTPIEVVKAYLPVNESFGKSISLVCLTISSIALVIDERFLHISDLSLAEHYSSQFLTIAKTP